MLSRKKVYAISIAIFACFVPAQTASLSATIFEDNTNSEYFTSSANVMNDVNSTLKNAKAENKLALFILGADWCHDSRAIASRLNGPELKSLLDDKYEVLLIDVGYFTHGNDVVERFGQPTLYATPTVMIIDPASGQLINGHNMHQWRDADLITTEQTINYFQTMASPDSHTQNKHKSSIPAIDKLLKDVSAFELKQAIRIKNGYQQMVPYLKMTKKERPKKFYEIWVELRDLRYALTDDTARLRREIFERTQAGELKIKLKYPNYKAFSWE